MALLRGAAIAVVTALVLRLLGDGSWVETLSGLPSRSRSAFRCPFWHSAGAGCGYRSDSCVQT